MKPRVVPSKLVCAACESLPLSARCPAPETCARNFVLSGWSSSFKHSREAGMITAKNWTSIMHREIAEICARPECRVLIAVDQMYLGFIAGEPQERVVYYCFVKDDYRRHGIAGHLFDALGIDPKSSFVYPANTFMLSHEGGNLRTKIPLARRDPSVARYPKAERRRSYANP